MPKTNPYISSVNSGEFSPRMEARTDFAAYPNACKSARNVVLLPQGGMTRRPGTRYVAEVKTSADATRLFPFTFNESTAYMLEHGDLYIRFYQNQTQTTVADTDAAVSNGLFASNITGWDDRSTGSAAIAHDSTNQRMQLTGSEDGIAWAEDAITVADATEQVSLQFDIAGFGGGTVKFQVGSATTLADIVEETELDVGCHVLSFTPGSGNTTFYIQFKNDTKPVRNMYIDNVVFLDNAALELVSPFPKADLSEIRTFQVADALYMLHEDYWPRRIERRGDSSWSIVEAFFEDGPWLDINPDSNLEERQILKNPDFSNGLQGWDDDGGGNSSVTHDETQEIVTLKKDSADQARLRQSNITVTANIKHVVHFRWLNYAKAIGTDSKFRAGCEETGNGASSWFSSGITVGGQSYEFTPTQTTLFIEFEHDTTNDTGGLAFVEIYDESAHLLEASATTGEVTIEALGFDPFTSSDVGRYLRMEWPGQEPGYGVITAFTDADTVTMLVLRDLAETTPTESWRFGAWGGGQGHPKVGGLFDNRLVFGNSTEEPRTLWFTQANDLNNMRPDSFVSNATTAEDDDAINVTLTSKRIDPIHWISPQVNLLVGTAGGEWQISAGSGSNISPSNIQARETSFVPCANIEPVSVNNITIFADKSEREMYDIVFNDTEQSYVPRDLTILSDHIFRSPAAEIVYQRRPYSTAWVRRDDGRVSVLAYNRQQEVLGWTQLLMGGSLTGSNHPEVESIAVIPGSSDTSSQTYASDERDEVWVIVKRTINSSTVQYIEVFEGFYEGVLREDYDNEPDWLAAMRTDQVDAVYLDSCITYDGSSTTSMTGLSHLEGESVTVLADGKVLANETVSSGAITIDQAATKVQIGLAYTHNYESLKIISGTAEATNKVKIIYGLGVAMLDTGTFDVAQISYDEEGRSMGDTETIDFYYEGIDPSAAPAFWTGEKNVGIEGRHTNDARIYMTGSKPVPFTVIGIAPLMKREPMPSRS